MIKTFYVQTDKVNRITDVISFSHEDYKKVELYTPLPPQIIGGCYELLVDNSIVYRKEWDKSDEKQRISDLENAIAELAYGGTF